jgi:hypothetical protein
MHTCIHAYMHTDLDIRNTWMYLQEKVSSFDCGASCLCSRSGLQLRIYVFALFSLKLTLSVCVNMYV